MSVGKQQFDPERNRLDYSQMLCPPPGYELEFAVGMTYSLDMEALLGVPVSLGMFESMDSSAVQNPFFLLEAIRKSSDKLAIFCNGDGIKMPQNIRPVYALLENSIFPVPLDGNANFHPKLWVVKYRSDTGPAWIKVIVLSRNLTFDRSIDIAAEVTGVVGRKVKEENRPLADMLSFVKKFAQAEKRSAISGLARDVMKVERFECEEPFETCRFLPFGIPRYKNRAMGMVDDAQKLIVVSPFLSDSVIERLGQAPDETALVTRLNSVTRKAWGSFQSVYVPSGLLLDDELLGEADQASGPKRDLHAKMYFKTVGSKHYLYLGSLNASANACFHNVEFMLELKYKPYRVSYSSVLEDLVTGNPMFEQLTEFSEPEGEPEGEETMDGLRDVLDAITGAAVKPDGQQYRLTVFCDPLEKPAEIAPLYRNGSFARLRDEVEFPNMLLRELCELYVIRRGDQCCLAKLPTGGIPEERDSAIYNAVIGNKSGFLAYVAFLLADNYVEAGIEQRELMELLDRGSDTNESVIPSALYERLLRTAAFYPKRLDVVEKIMERVSPELVNDDFRALIGTFRKATRRE